MNNRLAKISSMSLLVLLSISMMGCSNNTPTYDIHTDEQKSYLEGDYNLISLYADGTKELSKPKYVHLEWEDFSSDPYRVYVSKSEDFNELAADYFTGDSLCFIDNLEINTTYYWYVESNDKKTDVATFKIESHAPRSLNIDGLTNARDLGGYVTSDGTYTNQGLIYRTSRLNENETTTNLITEYGINAMNNILKIKSELDIRRVDNNENGGITASPLGSKINYYSVPMKSGGNCILLNKDVLDDAFEILGNENNYPIVIHCSIGTDRTGMLCFLINALLGVSEEDLYKDYLYSNFANIGGNRTPSTLKSYLDMIKREDGDTLADKTKNYLLSVGVNEEDINKLIDIMK